ncbi:MAG: hypothetical protein WBC44_07070 [Planctomycetaceae bacterium]
MTTFRDRVESAIESHEPLDTPELRRLSLAADGDDRAYWRSQMQLDRAIADWQQELRPRRSPAAIVRRAAAVLSITAAGVAAGWLSGASLWFASNDQAARSIPSNDVVMIAEPEIGVPPVSSHPVDQTLAQHQLTSDQYAEAAETAGRLAYAFEPVGDRVGTVVRFLVDAVPGSDVFAM